MSTQPDHQASKSENGGNGSPKTARSPWDVLLVTVILAALILLTVYVVHHYAGSSTDAATILGIVVPAFATIGAAVFGVTVAYSAGSAKGQARGATDATKALSDQITGRVQKAIAGIDDMHGTLSTEGISVAGSRAVRLFTTTGEGQSRPVDLQIERLDEAKSQLSNVLGVLQKPV